MVVGFACQCPPCGPLSRASARLLALMCPFPIAMKIKKGVSRQSKDSYEESGFATLKSMCQHLDQPSIPDEQHTRNTLLE